MYKKEDTVGFQVRTLSNLIKRQRELEKNDFGDVVSGIQAWTIGYLFNNQDRVVYQKDIEKEFNIRRSTVTTLLQSMEKKDLIKRTSVSGDKRLKQITLTDKSIKLHINFLNNVELTENTIRKGISDEELQIFFNCLNKMQNNLIEYQKGVNNED